MKRGEFMKRKKPRVFQITVAGAIVKNQKVLLLQRKKERKILPGILQEIWEFPKGRRKFNETSINALKREIKEETGLSVVIDVPISVFEYVVETEKEIKDITAIVFLAYPTPPDQAVRINPREHQAAGWFTSEELLLQNIPEEIRIAAILALRISSKNKRG